MLTAMKLMGNPDSITEYHSREENYYYQQGNSIDEILNKDEGLSYIQVNGMLTKEIGYDEGENISEVDFSNLLSGKNRKGEELFSKEHKIHGIDFTFSAPKSVSIQSLLFKDTQIISAHDEAVIETMKEIESSHAFSIQRDKNNNSTTKAIETKKFCFVSVRDGFSREHDPHLHTHCILMNMTENDNKFCAVDMARLFRGDFNKVFGSIYRSKLANKLSSIGYSVSYTKKGEFRLDCIPYEMERKFSKRNKQIQDAKGEKNEKDMIAWKETRSAKNPTVDKKEILDTWNSEAKEVLSELSIKYSENENILKIDDFKSAEQAERERTVHSRKEWAEQARSSIEAQQENRINRADLSEDEKWRLSLRRATDKTAWLTRKELITEYLSDCLRSEKFENITYQECENRLNEQIKRHRIVKQGEFYTSNEMIHIEKEYFNFAGELLSYKWKNPDKKELENFMEEYQTSSKAKNGRGLSEVQFTGVMKAIKSQRIISCIQGDAGAGKTTALKAITKYYKDQDIEVLGLAMQGVAAKNLENEAGATSLTLASYLGRKNAENAKPKVILFDEASMLDSRNALALLKKAEKTGDKIILIGDINQLGAISAGKPFERFVEYYNELKETIFFNENYRQKDPDLREAVDLAKQGKMEECLEKLDKSPAGGIIEEKNKAVRLAKVAKLYNNDTLILANTRNTKKNLDFLIRDSLVNKNEVDKTEQIFSLMEKDEEGIDVPKEMNLAVGDIIVFTQNDYQKYPDNEIRNGQRVKITNIKDTEITYKNEAGKEFIIDTKKYNYIDYGYAMTTYKSQGQTFNKVVVDADTSISSLNDMRNAYVQITRCRDDIKIYTDDKESFVELAKERNVEKDTMDILYARKAEDVKEKMDKIEAKKEQKTKKEMELE
jgi:conjugative relaxase-like TrwC/TraI family protein